MKDLNWPTAAIVIALVAAAVALIITGHGWWVLGPFILILMMLTI